MAKQDADVQRVQRALDELGEHFDTVQIFTTRHEAGAEGGTVNICLGVGNWFARYGLVKDWTTKEEEASREKARQSVREDN